MARPTPQEIRERLANLTLAELRRETLAIRSDLERTSIVMANKSTCIDAILLAAEEELPPSQRSEWYWQQRNR